ncbi:hypothetical protein [Flavobacterium sp.]|jgi:hypothetical protein|uniref:hypothetical protein n=1 Tax=Flavobacterium sp. TaxID=239 RepID=UPI0037C06738
MKTIFITILFFLSLNSYSQIKEFNTNDLKKIISLTGFKPIKNLKGLDQQQLNQYFNTIEADTPLLQQLNIDAWAYCVYKKIDNFETYNYYYKDISRATFDNYCKEINALMLLDGVIIQPK